MTNTPASMFSTLLAMILAHKLAQENVPLLHALVNPGLRQRHWTEISNVIGFEMGPDPTMTLNKARHARAMATFGDRSVIKRGNSPWISWENDGK